MYDFRYDYVKRKYGKKIKIMLHDSFIVYIEQKTFSQILQNMLKQDLLFEIID